MAGRTGSFVRHISEPGRHKTRRIRMHGGSSGDPSRVQRCSALHLIRSSSSSSSSSSARSKAAAGSSDSDTPSSSNLVGISQNNLVHRRHRDAPHPICGAPLHVILRLSIPSHQIVQIHSGRAFPRFYPPRSTRI